MTNGQDLLAELDRIEQLPMAAQVAPLIAVAKQAAARELDEIVFEAKYCLMSAYVHGNMASSNALGIFAQLVQMAQMKPLWWHERHRHLLMWANKWAVSVALREPSISADKLDRLLDDMAERYLAEGELLTPVLRLRYSVASHRNGALASQREYEAWTSAPRTALSDCAACEPYARVVFAAASGNHQDVVDEVSAVLQNQVSCLSEPQTVLAAALPSLLLAGETQLARTALMTSMRRLGKDNPRGAVAAELFAHTARAGEIAHARELVADFHPLTSKSGSPLSELRRHRFCVIGLDHLIRAGHGDVELVSEQETLTASLWFEQHRAAMFELADQFDARNGNSRQRLLAEQATGTDALPSLDLLHGMTPRFSTVETLLASWDGASSPASSTASATVPEGWSAVVPVNVAPLVAHASLSEVGPILSEVRDGLSGAHSLVTDYSPAFARAETLLEGRALSSLNSAEAASLCHLADALTGSSDDPALDAIWIPRAIEVSDQHGWAITAAALRNYELVRRNAESSEDLSDVIEQASRALFELVTSPQAETLCAPGIPMLNMVLAPLLWVSPTQDIDTDPVVRWCFDACMAATAAEKPNLTTCWKYMMGILSLVPHTVLFNAAVPVVRHYVPVAEAPSTYVRMYIGLARMHIAQGEPLESVLEQLNLALDICERVWPMSIHVFSSMMDVDLVQVHGSDGNIGEYLSQLLDIANRAQALDNFVQSQYPMLRAEIRSVRFLADVAGANGRGLEASEILERLAARLEHVYTDQAAGQSMSRAEQYAYAHVLGAISRFAAAHDDFARVASASRRSAELFHDIGSADELSERRMSAYGHERLGETAAGVAQVNLGIAASEKHLAAARDHTYLHLLNNRWSLFLKGIDVCQQGREFLTAQDFHNTLEGDLAAARAAASEHGEETASTVPSMADWYRHVSLRALSKVAIKADEPRRALELLDGVAAFFDGIGDVGESIETEGLRGAALAAAKDPSAEGVWLAAMARARAHDELDAGRLCADLYTDWLWEHDRHGEAERIWNEWVS